MVINVRVHRMMVAIIGATFLILVMILLMLKFIFAGADNQLPEAIPPETRIYGEFVPWSEVDRLLPRGSKATITDLDTGIPFQVQRRGGSSHIDAQPLTAADSAAMKRAYDGKWSWKRRAVTVELPDGRKIAASMAGMPHGQGAIANNEFDGHFCIHFRDSKTHGSHRVDLAHQMMVWKASNRVDLQVIEMPPEDVIALLFTAIDQREHNIAAQLIYPDMDINPLILQLQQVDRIKYENIHRLDDNQYSVDLRIIFLKSDREVKEQLLIKIEGDAPPWRIAASSIISLLEPTLAPVFSPIDDWTTEEDWEQ